MIGGPGLSGGKYADVLRVLGRLVTTLDAQAVEIEERGHGLAVSWQRRLTAQRRQYTWLQIADLRETAQRQRGQAGVGPVHERVELLRTLGQELDRQGVQLQHLVEEAEGYRVRLQRPDSPTEEPVVQAYGFEDLRQLSQQRRATRRPDTGPRVARA